MPPGRVTSSPRQRRARRRRELSLCAAMAAGYVLLLIGLWALGSAVAMPIAIVPVALAAWFFGAAGGAFMAALLGCVHLSFFHGIEHSLGPLTRDALTGNLLLLGIGAGLGLFRSRVRGQLQRQQQSEQRYEIAARGANDGLWDWNLRTDEVYFSAPLAQMLGYAPQELGKNPDEWLQRVHPDDLPRVRRQLDAHLQRETERFECEHRVRRRDGGWLWVLGRGVATADADGTPRRITGWLTDIAARKQSEDQLRHHAFHDKLTGLPNRALFMDRLANAIARSRRNAGQRFALLLLDLDRFKVVNDSLGHVGGDELLESVAVRLQVCLRPGDTIGRLGGDEFLILLEEISRPEDAGLVAERIHASLSAPLPLGGHEVVTTASIGIAVGDQHTVSPHDLLRDADTAMYEAKNLGKGRHVMFDAQMHTRAVERLSMENALREAVDRQQMRVYYQPIVSLDSGAIVGFEALARWMHPELGMVSPAQFIPLAEETGVISEIGQWVLLEACSQLKSWQQQFVRDPPLRVSVNLSVRQMHDIDMIDRMRGALDSTRLAPDSLAMEITESMIMEDQSLGPRLLEALRSAGVKVYMDDFGTGYSSLSYLQRFRVDALKIDGSFVRNLDRGNDRGNVVRSIITLAQSLGLKVVAEGVETEQQLARLRELGCDEAQGYLFSRPVAPDDLEPLLLDDQRW